MFNFFRKSPPKSYSSIQPAEAFEKIGSEESIVIIDVRSAAEFRQGHIPGARLIPLDVLINRATEVPTQQPVILSCRSGARSKMACEQLASIGFKNLTNLEGGFLAWQRAGLPTK